MILYNQKPLLGRLPLWTPNPMGIVAPIGAWLRGSGDAIIDDSLNGNKGTFENGAFWKGGRIEFDGSDDLVNFGAPDNLRVGPELTVCARILRRTNDQNYEGIAAYVKTASPYGGYGLWSMTDGTIRAQVNNHYADDIKTTNAISNNICHDLILRCDGTNYAIFVDGLKASADKTISNYDSSLMTAFRFGKSVSGHEMFDGTIGYVYIFDYAFTPAQIAYIHQHPYYAWEYPEIWEYYVAAGWTGKLNGVTNPAKINGVAIANISKVMGIL